MNKQEVISKLKSAIPKNNIDDYQRGEAAGLNFALLLLAELDEPVRPPEPKPLEPEKPVVPQFVADWVDNSREYSFDFGGWFYYENQPSKVYDWLNPENKRQAELNTLALVTLIVNGHNAVDIKQEKLYTVEIPNPNGGGYSKNYLAKNKNGKVELFTWSGYTSIEFADNWKQEENAQLTESEIKKDFDWAWQFAEEVEE